MEIVVLFLLNLLIRQLLLHFFQLLFALDQLLVLLILLPLQVLVHLILRVEIELKFLGLVFKLPLLTCQVIDFILLADDFLVGHVEVII